MRKVFIDCGAHDGSSARLFIKKLDPTREYEIFSFEPPSTSSSKNERLKKLEEKQQVSVIRKAVWIYDGEITFYDNGRSGASLLEEKRQLHRGIVKPIEQLSTQTTVECLDLSKWIQENFDKEDHIILKMDIEGAEYEVVKKMYKDGTLGLVDKLYCELHGLKVGIPREETDELINLCRERGHELYMWDAQAAELKDAGKRSGTVKFDKFYNKRILDAQHEKWVRLGFKVSET